MSYDDIYKFINYIAIIYICLPILFLLFFGIYYLTGRTITTEKWTPIISFGKWYIISVALVFFGKMYEMATTERETSMKEMTLFDKYSNIILNSDSIDIAWSYARYYSIVTPSERLRTRWTELKDTLKVSLDSIVKLRSVQEKVLGDKTLSVEVRVAKLDSINIEMAKARPTFLSKTTTPDPKAAKSFELTGFNHLLDEDLDGAILAFLNAENIILP
jgi:hypothetical protein